MKIPPLEEGKVSPISSPSKRGRIKVGVSTVSSQREGEDLGRKRKGENISEKGGLGEGIVRMTILDYFVI